MHVNIGFTDASDEQNQDWVRQAGGQGAVGIVRRLGALDNLLRCALGGLQAAGDVCTNARGRACFSKAA